jgi:hypothetical protein
MASFVYLKQSFQQSLKVVVATLGLFATVIALPVPAQAVSVTRYVAATGSVGTGASCASPGFVGANNTAIQAAMNAAASGDTIHICTGTYSISTRLEVTKSLTIEGDGANLSTLDGLGTTQIMIIQDNNLAVGSGSEITVNVNSLGFINGYAGALSGVGECVDGNRCGGAIFIESESRFHISDSYFYNNYADFGGGAVARFMGNYQEVPATINRSTFESNTAKLDGGGVATFFGFGLTINASTFFKNKYQDRDGAAVVSTFATATINDSTFVDNSGGRGSVLAGGITVSHSIVARSNSSMDKACSGGGISMSGTLGNLVTDNSCTSVTSSYPASPATNSAIVEFSDLKLGDLTYRGYSNKTIPLLNGSVANDFWTGCSGNDQHGFSRPQGTKCDVGAYERPSNQNTNALSGWSYGSTSIDRTNGATVAVVSQASNAASLSISYASLTTSVCTINEFTGTITILTLGTCNVTASTAGLLLNDQDLISKSLTISGVFPPSVSSAPTISGTARAGLTLTAANGTWSNSPTSYTYQWKSASTSSGTYTDISNANSSTYVLTASDVDRYIKVSVSARNASGTSGASLSSATAVVVTYLDGLAPVLSSATATDDGFTFLITNYSASYTYAATTTSGSVSLTEANGVVSGLRANGSATVTVTSSRVGYSTLSATRQGSTVVTSTTTSTTTSTIATPVVTVPQGQASVATIAPNVGPTTTILNPMRSQVPQSSTTTIPPVVTTIANAPAAVAPKAPVLAPGEAGALVNGQTTAATLSRADNQLTATTGDITTTVSGLTSDGKRVALNSEGTLVLNEGDSLVVSASGFSSNTDLEVWMFSTPTQIGVITAGADGKASGTFALPDGIKAGDHRLVLIGKNSDGADALVGLGLSYGTVESGSSLTRVLIAIPIALAVLFGLFLPAVTRRRRKRLVAA